MDEEIQSDELQCLLRASSPPPPGYRSGPEPDLFATGSEQSRCDRDETSATLFRACAP
jgi:hypothetical protein